MNHRCTDYIRIEGEEVEDVESFVCLGSVLEKLGGTEADIKRRLALARNAFTRLQNIWRSGRFSQKTKLRILHSNVLSLLLFGVEMWRVTTTDLNKLDVFHRTCLRRVLRRLCSNHLSNEELYEATGSTPVSALTRVIRWRWIRHILRTSPGNIPRTALTWAPEGKRRRGRPRETWRRTAEKERNQLGWHSWPGLRSYRRQTGMDGAIFWSASRGGTAYNGLCQRRGSARKEYLFRLQVYKRVGISQVQVYERLGKFFIQLQWNPALRPPPLLRPLYPGSNKSSVGHKNTAASLTRQIFVARW